MTNSDVSSESTENSTEVSNTQHTSGVATSERNYDQTVGDIENQNMPEVAVEIDPPIVIETSFNQQQHPVEDIENPNLEEFDGAPPNFVQQHHIVQDDGNQNWEGVAAASPSEILQLPDTIQVDGSQTSEEFNGAPPNFDQQLQDNDRNGEGVAPASPSVILQLPNTVQDTSGVATSERNYDQTVQDIENQNMQEVSVEVDRPIVIGTSFNQQQHPVEDIENPNLEEFDGAPPNFVQQQHIVQDDGNQNWEGVAAASPSEIQVDGSQTSEAEGTARQSAPEIELMDRTASQSPPEIESMDRAALEAEGTARQPDPGNIESMYRAALEGDWAEAEKLLKKYPTLAYKERYCYLPDRETERKWYRPLHVAVALKHDKFALKLIDRMNPEYLKLPNSNGVGPCGYAAAHGMPDIAKTIINQHPNILEESGETYEVLTLWAALSGKSKVVSYFLEQTGEEMDGRWKQAWFSLLQNAIRYKMYGMALKILEKDSSFAIERNEKGTALHVLARQDISAATTGKPAMIFRSIFGTTLKGRQGEGEMPKDFRSLAMTLLAEIQKLKDKREQFDLLSNPPILHDAAKVGNVDLIRMITRAYPDLIWQTGDEGASLISIAIECREANVFSFIQRFRALDKISFFFDEARDENNLLHLAAKLGPRKNAIPALQMQSELAWFKAVEAMLPLNVTEERNEHGQKPREMFVEEHKKLLKESKAWMKSTSDSCMLIATIILTVVYAAAFTVPGGNSEATGLPNLVKSNWLTCFFVFEALALFSSALCIITFWSITCSGFEEDQFFDILPYQLRLGFSALFSSLIGAIAAFMSAYHLVLVQGRVWLVKSILLLICVILVLAILGRLWELWSKLKLPKSLPRNFGAVKIRNQAQPNPGPSGHQP